MKPIKFRGRTEDKTWVKGQYCKVVKDCHVVRHTIITSFTIDELDWYQPMIDYDEVDEKTIGQFTGLKDINGVEIYEGDILRNVDNPFVDKLPFKVVWNEHYGAWFWWSLLGEVGTDHLHQHIAKDCEVIGNVYDNLELMEGEK